MKFSKSIRITLLSIAAFLVLVFAVPFLAKIFTKPKPTPLGNAPDCTLYDLGITATWEKMGGTLAADVTVTNASLAPCAVSGYPHLAFVTADGKPLAVDVRNVLKPTPTVMLAPNESAYAAFLWQNWCSPVPAGGAVVVVGLPGQTETAAVTPMDAAGHALTNFPGCAVPTAPSDAILHPFAPTFSIPDSYK